MKALAIHGAEDLRWEDRPVPQPGPDEVRLRVGFVGICGSDLHYHFHGANGEYVVREPLTPGHELSGVVDLDPSGDLAPGTPVTVHPARFGTVEPGLEDRPHLWPGGDYLGSASTDPHRQGAAAELLLVGRSMVRPLPDGMPVAHAALAEPLAVALHALAVSPDVRDRRVLVLGAGPIGLLAVAALRHAGAAGIAVSDLRPEPLERARAQGADELLLAGTDEVPVTSYDVVLECSGAAPALTQAVRAVRRAGVVVQVGMLPNAEISVNLAPMLAKEVQLRGAFRFSDEIDRAVAMLAADPSIADVITHTVPAAEAARAMEIARDPALSGKVLLDLA